MPNYRIGQALETPLKDFAPDVDPTTPGIILLSDGYVPSFKGYLARNSPAAYAPALPSSQTPTGGYIALFSDGTVKVYATSATDLYRLDAGAWTNVGTGFTATTRWRFAQFGDDVIAVAGATPPQVAMGPTSAFSALAGGAPAGATNVISVASLVFMTAGATWYNSAIGQDNNWTPNIQTQAATGVFTDFPGPVVALAPLFRNVIIFKQGSMLLGQLVGGESIWNFQLLSDETGSMCQESVVTLPEAVAFLGADDFYITTGNAPQRIPNNCKEWFFANADSTQFSNMLSWYDHTSSIIYWHFVGLTPPTTAVPDLWIAYNVRANRWATGKLVTYYVVPNTQSGLDTGLFFDTNKALKTWTGSPGQAFIKTGYIGDPGRLTQVMRVKPKYNVYPVPATGSTPPDVLIPFHTNVLGQVPVQDAAATRGADGWHYFRAYSRYHQVQINTNGPAEVVGVAAEIRQGGVQ